MTTRTVAALALAVALVGCGTSLDTARLARLKFINAQLGSDRVVVELRGYQVHSGLPFGTSGPWIELVAGSTSYRLTEQRGSTHAAGQLSLAEGERLHLILWTPPTAETAEATLWPVKVSDRGFDRRAGVRVFNGLAADQRLDAALEVSFANTVEAYPLVRDLGGGEVSGVVGGVSLPTVLPAVGGRLSLRLAGTTTPLDLLAITEVGTGVLNVLLLGPVDQPRMITWR